MQKKLCIIYNKTDKTFIYITIENKTHISGLAMLSQERNVIRIYDANVYGKIS